MCSIFIQPNEGNLLILIRVGIFLLDRKPNLYDVAEHIATKVEVNPQMLLTLKNVKSILIINLGENFETPMVGTLNALNALVKGQIGKGSS